MHAICCRSLMRNDVPGRTEAIAQVQRKISVCTFRCICNPISWYAGMDHSGTALRIESGMNLKVESHASPFRDEEPHAFFLGQQRINVIEIVDRWLAPEYGYFKILADDGASYILRHDLPSHSWELTLFQAP
jgi:hypothetical protein